MCFILSCSLLGHREPKRVGAVFLLARPTPRGLIRYPKISIPMMFNKLPKKFKARAFLNYKLLNFHLIFKELYKTPPYLVTATFNRSALREIGSQSFSYSSTITAKTSSHLLHNTIILENLRFFKHGSKTRRSLRMTQPRYSPC